ncbi:MAG: metalloregulator ArsR/SmtB family transcription factor [Bacteroidia bacterium]|nr:metalloregulator ArsR/SmtB family transcription factor [Bacteroidia bacterium]
MKSSKINSEPYVTKIAQVLRVIAHPVRLQVLAVLREQDELNVSQLSDAISLDVQQSLLSHHLVKMRENGILRCTKKGMYVYYEVVDKKLYNILDCMENCDII